VLGRSALPETPVSVSAHITVNCGAYLTCTVFIVTCSSLLVLRVSYSIVSATVRIALGCCQSKGSKWEREFLGDLLVVSLGCR
jgi:hypothetical protein